MKRSVSLILVAIILLTGALIALQLTEREETRSTTDKLEYRGNRYTATEETNNSEPKTRPAADKSDNRKSTFTMPEETNDGKLEIGPIVDRSKYTEDSYNMAVETHKLLSSLTPDEVEELESAGTLSFSWEELVKAYPAYAQTVYKYANKRAADLKKKHYRSRKRGPVVPPAITETTKNYAPGRIEFNIITVETDGIEDVVPGLYQLCIIQGRQGELGEMWLTVSEPLDR